MSLFRTVIFLIILFGLLGSGHTASAQSEATAIDHLTVDFWPDYDRTAVLVLLTGTLPDDTSLPASVTIPLPPGVTLNAVARITSDNVMTDDVQFTEEDGQVTFITPDNRFRIEYYIPYTANGSQREFEFNWLADITVNEIDVAVQQPAAATNMNTQPAASSINTNSNDGLTYHVLPVTAVPGGQSYTVQVDYTMNEPTLSIDLLNTTETVPVTSTPAGNDFNWPVLLAIAGGVLILAAVAWQVVGSRRQPKRARKTSPPRPPASPKGGGPKVGTAQFCHECGAPVGAEDKFCRECGTAVKNR